MAIQAAPTDPISSRFNRKWLWGVAVGLAAVVCLALFFYLPRISAVYDLYWSQAGIRQLFYEDLGFSEAWSSFFAVVGSFFYALAWVPLSLWTYRVLAWRFSSRQLLIAFSSWVLVYGHVPLLHALLGSQACINQATGEPLKWYVEQPDGRLVLFDSGGFDTATGSQKRRATPQVCARFAAQNANGRPHKITTEVRELEFFNPSTGQPRVWYHKAVDGSFDLFDAPGYDPATGAALVPVSKELVGEIRARAAKDTQEAMRQREVEESKLPKPAQPITPSAVTVQHPAAEPATVALATTAECPGKVQNLELGQSWMLINPGRKCRIISNFPDGSATFADPQGVFPAGGWQTRNPDRVRAVSGSLSVAYSLCPLESGNRPLNWDCTPL